MSRRSIVNGAGGLGRGLLAVAEVEDDPAAVGSALLGLLEHRAEALVGDGDRGPLGVLGRLRAASVSRAASRALESVVSGRRTRVAWSKVMTE